MESRLVGGVGPVPARGLILGEAPGAEEDLQGVPFVGASGRLLDELMEQVGGHRSMFYITNAYKHRPPDNRNPTDHELAEHWPLLQEELDLVKPDVILTLGKVARNVLLPHLAGQSLGPTRGHWYEYGPLVQVLATWHPSYVLRGNRQARKELADDVDEFVYRATR